MSEIDELRQKVELFERVIRRLVETPAIWMSPSFRPILTELGYSIEGSGRDERLVPPQSSESNARIVAGPEK